MGSDRCASGLPQQPDQAYSMQTWHKHAYLSGAIIMKAISHSYVPTRDVTDSKSGSESDGIRYFSRNPKAIGYLKSDRNGFNIFVSVQLYNYFRK